MKKLRLFMGAGLLSAALPVCALAQEIPNIPSPDVIKKIKGEDKAPILKFFEDSGVELTYLGEAGGLAGYLGESASGTLQTFYVTPDGNHVVAGVLFRAGGTNVTGVQIADMGERFEAAKRSADRAGSAVHGISPMDVPEAGISGGLKKLDSDAVRAGEAKAAEAKDYLSLRNMADVKAELENAAWFHVGAEDAPVIYMVADPNCPFCHRAWQQLRPKVNNAEVSVRVVMIAGLEGSEAEAISILSRENPARAWFKGEGSTRTMPVAAPPPAGSTEFENAKQYLNWNMRMIDRLGVSSTPHMFYVNNGALYESRGIPEDMNVFVEGAK